MNTVRSLKIGAIYYAVLSIIATLVIKYITHMMGFGELFPLFRTLILGIVTASIFGSFFGRWVINLKKPYKTKAFWLGFLLVIVALPFYDLGLLYIFTDTHPSLFAGGSGANHLALVYLFIIIYSFILSGIWLAILSGLASIYLRDKFIPDLARFQQQQQEGSEQTQEIVRDNHST